VASLLRKRLQDFGADPAGVTFFPTNLRDEHNLLTREAENAVAVSGDERGRRAQLRALQERASSNRANPLETQPHVPLASFP